MTNECINIHISTKRNFRVEPRIDTINLVKYRSVCAVCAKWPGHGIDALAFDVGYVDANVPYILVLRVYVREITPIYESASTKKPSLLCNLPATES